MQGIHTPLGSAFNPAVYLYCLLTEKNNIRDVGSTADLVLVLLVHLVHWYLVHGLIGTSGALVPGTLVPTVT